MSYKQEHGRMQRNKLPECPYCGVPDEMWWPGVPPQEGSSKWMAICGFCNQKYIVNCTITVSFTTNKVP